jgi:hypothetical protein
MGTVASIVLAFFIILAILIVIGIAIVGIMANTNAPDVSLPFEGEIEFKQTP